MEYNLYHRGLNLTYGCALIYHVRYVPELRGIGLSGKPDKPQALNTAPQTSLKPKP